VFRETSPHVENFRLLIVTDREIGGELFTLATMEAPGDNSLRSQLLSISELEQFPWFYNPSENLQDLNISNSGNSMSSKFVPKNYLSSSGSARDKDMRPQNMEEMNMTANSWWTWPYLNCTGDWAQDLENVQWLVSFTTWFPVDMVRRSLDGKL